MKGKTVELYHSLIPNRDMDSVKKESKKLREKIIKILFTVHNPFSMMHALTSSIIFLIQRTVKPGKQKESLDICIKSLQSMSGNLDEGNVMENEK